MTYPMEKVDKFMAPILTLRGILFMAKNKGLGFTIGTLSSTFQATSPTISWKAMGNSFSTTILTEVASRTVLKMGLAC